MTPQELYLKGKKKEETIPFHPIYNPIYTPITNPCYFPVYPEIKKKNEKSTPNPRW